MVDYARAQLTADRLIKKNGRIVTIIQPSDAKKEWEPWSGEELNQADGSALRIDVFGVFADSRTMGQEYNITDLPDGNKLCLVSALALGDNLMEHFRTVDDGGAIWSIVDLKILQPGPVRLLYVLGLGQ